MKIPQCAILPLLIIVMVSGCFGNSQKMPNSHDPMKIKVNTIAVLPVDHQGADGKAAQLLRTRISEEIYFKGYSRIPLEEMDKKLTTSTGDSDKEKKSLIAPEMLKNLVGADAGMYCTLTENHSSRFFYSPVTISVVCELRNTNSGDVIWKATSESTERNFDLTRKRLERKKRETYEDLIDDVVHDMIKTLPDGPNLRG